MCIIDDEGWVSCVRDTIYLLLDVHFSLVVRGGGYETGVIHSKSHSKKSSYTIWPKSNVLATVASRLEQILKANIALYPENLLHSNAACLILMLHVPNMDLDAVEQGCHIKNSDMYKYTFHEFRCREKYVNHVIPCPPSPNKGNTNIVKWLSNQPLQSLLIAKPHASQNYVFSLITHCPTLCNPRITNHYWLANPMPSLNYKSCPTPCIWWKHTLCLFPLSHLFAPDSDSPSRTTCVEG